jgi:hypothetical protein
MDMLTGYDVWLSGSTGSLDDVLLAAYAGCVCWLGILSQLAGYAGYDGWQFWICCRCWLDMLAGYTA